MEIPLNREPRRTQNSDTPHEHAYDDIAFAWPSQGHLDSFEHSTDNSGVPSQRHPHSLENEYTERPAKPDSKWSKAKRRVALGLTAAVATVGVAGITTKFVDAGGSPSPSDSAIEGQPIPGSQPSPEATETMSHSASAQLLLDVYGSNPPGEVRLGVGGYPNMQSVVSQLEDGTFGEKSAQKFLDGISASYNSANFRGNNGLGQFEEEIKNSVVDAKMSSGMTTDDAHDEIGVRAMNAATDVILPLYGGVLPHRMFVFRFEYSGGEVRYDEKRITPYEFSFIAEVPASLTAKIRIVDPQNAKADKNGHVLYDIGPDTKPDGTRTPLVLGTGVLPLHTIYSGDPAKGAKRPFRGDIGEFAENLPPSN